MSELGLVVTFDNHAIFSIDGQEALNEVSAAGIVEVNAACRDPLNNGCSLAINGECGPTAVNNRCEPAAINGICGPNGECGAINVNCP